MLLLHTITLLMLLTPIMPETESLGNAGKSRMMLMLGILTISGKESSSISPPTIMDVKVSVQEELKE